MSSEEIVYSYGVLAEDGQYSTVADVDELYELIQNERHTEQESMLTDARLRQRSEVLGPPPEIKPENLAEARWGVIWPSQNLTADEEAHREALADLITHRQQQMNGKKPHEFNYDQAWGWDDFLWEEGRNIEPGNMVPDTVPYYLCIVASPERISWDFQQHLDAEYAVGRLWFDDPSDCERYVKQLIAYEDNRESRFNREALFVGPWHHDDRPTTESATRLIEPLHRWLTNQPDLRFASSLLLNERPDNEATKAHLMERLGAYDTVGNPQLPPALLFTASHGLEYKGPTDTQYANQGAPLFQEWPGLLTAPTPGHYLAGDQLSDDILLSGMVAFCFACYSAGTPLMQDWVPTGWLTKPKKLTDVPFIARLPQKLLSRGLLAFIGHVSRAWDYSFLGVKGAGGQIATFRSAIHQLLKGKRVGHAVDYMNTRWLQLAIQLDLTTTTSNVSKQQVVALWQARNDARGYVVLGDPAAMIKHDSLVDLDR